MLPAFIAGFTVIVILVLLRAVAHPLFPVIERKSNVVVVLGFTLIGLPEASFPFASNIRFVDNEPKVLVTIKFGVPVILKSRIVL